MLVLPALAKCVLWFSNPSASGQTLFSYGGQRGEGTLSRTSAACQETKCQREWLFYLNAIWQTLCYYGHIPKKWGVHLPGGEARGKEGWPT